MQNLHDHAFKRKNPYLPVQPWAFYMQKVAHWVISPNFGEMKVAEGLEQLYDLHLTCPHHNYCLLGMCYEYSAENFRLKHNFGRAPWI